MPWKLAALLLPAICFAQQDIFNFQRAPYLDLARNANWGSTGRNNTDNNYLFTPPSPTGGFCLYIINNNPTNAHAFQLQIFESADQRVKSYSQNVGRFNTITNALSVSPQGNTGIPGSGTAPISIAAAQYLAMYVPSDGAAVVSVNVSGSSTQAGSPDTADIFITQAVTSGGCGWGVSSPLFSSEIVFSPPVQGGQNITPTIANRRVCVYGLELTVMGATTRVGVSNPSAGADWTYTVTTTPVVLKAVYAQLATSATVANRIPQLIQDDGANILGSNFAATATASQTVKYTWGSGAAFSSQALASSNVTAHAQVDDHGIMPPGWRIRTVTDAIQAADQWSAISLTIEFPLQIVVNQLLQYVPATGLYNGVVQPTFLIRDNEKFILPAHTSPYFCTAAGQPFAFTVSNPSANIPSTMILGGSVTFRYDL